MALLAVLMLAYGVRVHLLGAQSLWYDEGVAFGHSQRNLLDMIPMLQRNVHVPGYFWSLAVWEDLAGASEFSLRYLSVMFSILSVALTYALGKVLYGRVAGLTAAGFVALNTFSIYYAQEARMYAMLAAVAAASMWLFVHWTRAYLAQRRIFAYGFALALMNALGMYTHFSYALVMVAQGVMAVLWLLALWAGFIRLENPYFRPTSRYIRPGMEPIYTVSTTIRALLIYAILNLITIALFSPWLEVALRQTSSQPNISDIVPIEQMLRVLQGWFAFGLTFEDHFGGMGVALYFFLLFGLVILPRRPRGQTWAMLLPIVWVIVSSAIYLYFGLYERYLRFLLPTQIAAALWMGRGVWVLATIQPRQRTRLRLMIPRFAAAFATLALWFTFAQGLPYLYGDLRYQRDDYRGLASAISNQVSAQDRVVLSAPGVNEVFNYYYHGEAPVVLIPTTANPAAEAEAVITNSQLIQVVFYGEREQDPNGTLETTLNRDAFPIDSRWWGDVRWARYATMRELAAVELPVMRFGDDVTLESAVTSATNIVQGSREPFLLQLTWQTNQTLMSRYTVFVQVLDANGVLVGQRDSEPMNGSAPTTDWTPDAPITDRHALWLNNLPSGDYTVIVGMYDAATGQRLAADSGDYVTVTSLTIQG
jgi:uncharacterized membrane protein